MDRRAKGREREGRTCGVDALRDVEGLDALERVAAARLVVARDLRRRDVGLELALGEAVELLEEEVEDVESASDTGYRGLSDITERRGVRVKDALHVVE